MKTRTFLQNKLWRDKAIELMEATGSTLHWRRLNDGEYDQQLRLKMVEEAQEVVTAASRDALTNEVADVLEVMHALCKLHSIAWEEVIAAQNKKYLERGGYYERKFVTYAEHLIGSFGENYCLADQDKYPEIK